MRPPSAVIAMLVIGEEDAATTPHRRPAGDAK
jgi:hypothetical protein